MRTFSSCKDAVNHCISKHYFSLAHLFDEERTMNMHIHDCCEIYFSIAGGHQFLIDSQFYDVRPGDLFLINEYESHYLSQLDDSIHERIVLSIHPDLLKKLSTDTTDLSLCFNKPPRCHRLSLDKDQQTRFLYFVNKMTTPIPFGGDLLEQVSLTEMLLEINSMLVAKETSDDLSINDFQYNEQVKQMISYINDHIQDQLTIDHLSKQFFLSPSYICRIFKSTTGTTINKYIHARRITKAKSMLSSGSSINDVCFRCGFNDYSNFFRIFKKAVGISPKKYAQHSIS